MAPTRRDSPDEEEQVRRFEGKVVLVTGAASGIGRATALRVGSEGGKVVCADARAEALEDTVKQVERQGAESLAVVCDVSDAEAVAFALRSALDRFRRLDALCNIAGILRCDSTHQLALEDWNRVLAVNLTGTFLMCREAIPHLLEGKGSIVNTASTAALAGHPWTAAYSASKGGVLALTRGLAIEYGKQGLRANAVCPGAIETPIHDAFRIPEGVDRKLLRRIMPFDGEFRGPEQVAAAIAYLASDEARHVNGTELRIDGGMLA